MFVADPDGVNYFQWAVITIQKACKTESPLYFTLKSLLNKTSRLPKDCASECTINLSVKSMSH